MSESLKGCQHIAVGIVIEHQLEIIFWTGLGLLMILLLFIAQSDTNATVAFALLIIVAAVIMTRYLWKRIFRPILEVSGARRVPYYGGDRRYCRRCCSGCCAFHEDEGAKVKGVRFMLILILVIIYGIALSNFAAEIFLPTKNGVDPHPYTMFSMEWAGGVVLLFVSIWFADLFLLSMRLGATLWRRVKGKKEPLPKGPWWGGLALSTLVFVILVGVASVQGRATPRTAVIEVSLEKLPLCLDGYKLTMISDVHVGPTVGRKEVERHVTRANALGGDAILILGDLIDDHVEDISSLVEPIANLTAPDGVYFVNGNHEHYYRPSEWETYLTGVNITVLNNDRVTLPSGVEGACSFTLSGVDDFDGDPDYKEALGGRDEDKATVLMAHQPLQVSEAADYGVGLQLAGHTHGGQVFPYHMLVYLDQGYISGLYKKDNTLLYITEGTVGWGPRMRLLSQTEYTLVVLRSPEAMATTDSFGTTSGPAHAAVAAFVLSLISAIYCFCYPLAKTACQIGSKSTIDSSTIQLQQDSPSRLGNEYTGREGMAVVTETEMIPRRDLSV